MRDTQAVKPPRGEGGEYEFMNLLAHELRNPLASVISTLELLEIKEGERWRKDDLRIALTEARTIGMLLDNFLDAARARERNYSLHKKRLRLGEVLTLRLPLSAEPDAEAMPPSVSP